MILLLDNYDSFTHNLYQYLSEITDEPIEVIRNDAITVAGVENLAPDRIVISPGPGRPEDAGISVALIKQFAGRVPILGVCLGHQAIGYAYGGDIVQAGRIVHGKAEPMQLDGRGLFRSISSPAVFTRYHSLVIKPETLPSCLEVTAWSEDGEIMGVRHRELDIEGVQFHPESIASETGKQLLRHFLQYRREPFDPKQYLGKLTAGQDLSQHEAATFMEELTEGNLNDAQIAAFLAAIQTKGAAPEEIAGCAEVLQRKRIRLQLSGPAIDTCGTGGDGKGTFNISSLTALVASAAGARVAKHGNRAVSSRSGSAEFYTALGIKIDLKPEDARQVLEENGFAFLYAPLYHSAMRFAAPARKAMSIKTIMNLVGPLVNPAGTEYQIIGVYSEELVETMARAAQLLGVQRGAVVYGHDGQDELSVSAPSTLVRFEAGKELERIVVDPRELGLPAYKLEDIIGGKADDNADIARSVLAGKGPMAVADSVALNAGAALWIYGIAGDIAEGYRLAREVIDNGQARQKLEDTIRLTNEIPHRDSGSAGSTTTDGGAA
ncbi:bifunctional anthranilate synthase component II/anthranilate phosphoribosyltransferase [Spirochaeta africana]|uniref:Anthranilate phosphoribosyltransferase n=1 Tax=Spirochaeta africana (strain ATCC 700263 / DSM 8902 / Z-7692) TaxID=889378 RepID=H9UM37_SPIAZ|nr:bifunctional anthranilate synthase component II/anthranilate phosphoribosyltransferase [Spirochaeta africana]AFG38580.1 glutamine amidotransferase of anthranilate synthase or aminodeoxychorismate synthase [Spirochaeta africana DSM 8902]